jgi:hypothetical protein
MKYATALHLLRFLPSITNGFCLKLLTKLSTSYPYFNCLAFPFYLLHPFGVEIDTSRQREVTLGADKYIGAFVAEIK